MTDTRTIVAQQNILAARQIMSDYLESEPPFPQTDHARDAIRHLDKAFAYMGKCRDTPSGAA